MNSVCFRGLMPVLVLLLLAFPDLHSQSTSLQPQCDTSTVALDSGSVEVLITYHTGGGEESSQSGLEYVRFHVSGDTVITIDPGAILISGAGPAIDSVSTLELIDMIAVALVIRLVENSVIRSSGDCGSPAMMSVFIPNCVFRTGSGSGTLFTSVDQCQQSIREIKHCLVGGAASASITSRGSCQECGYGETTCGGGGAGLQ